MSCSQGDDHRDRVLPVEPDRDVADDQEQRDDDREDRRARDLAAEARRDVLRAGRLRAPSFDCEQLAANLSCCARRRASSSGPGSTCRCCAPRDRRAAALDHGVRPCRSRPPGPAHLSATPASSSEGDLLPPLKSMPRFSPCTASEMTPARMTTPEIANHVLRLPHEVDLQELAVLLALRAHVARVREPAEAGEQAEHRARRRDGRDQRDHGSDQQHQREALDLGGRDREEDERRDHGHDVRVDDRVEALRYPVATAARIDFPARTSSLMRSKMTTFASAATPTVRIRPAKPGSVSVTLKSRIAAYRKRRVDAEADDGHEAEEAVEDQQQDRDRDQAADRRLLRPGSASPCRAWPRPACCSTVLELDRQRTGLQDERDPLRLAARVPRPVICAAARRCRPRASSPCSRSAGTTGCRCRGRSRSAAGVRRELPALAYRSRVIVVERLVALAV